MPKRFTDTEKWKKHFVRNLTAPYKLLWLYILDECSPAGIWDVDMDVAQIRLGVKLKKETAEKILTENIIVIDNGKKWFIRNFVDFQYSQLQENNRAHTQIIATLKKFGLLDENLKIKNFISKAPYQAPYDAPSYGDMDMVMVKDMDMVMGMEQVMDKGATAEKITMPFDTPKFTEYWNQWKVYKEREFKFKFKSAQSEQAALNKLTELSGGVQDSAIAIILQSMANGWKGFFELKENINNGTSGTFKSDKQQQYKNVDAELAARYSGTQG